ncbi:MAG TPA: hypothetical protein VFR15_02160 [Chloroflexia bacterium]|nr:hypothetical protein [Chloroflexia bacterium]
MNAYANPKAGPTTGTTGTTGTAGTTASVTTVRPLERIAVGAAARIGAIAGGLIWVLGAAVATAFDLFSVDLWRTVIEGRWVASPGWESLPVFMENFGGLVLGTLGVILFGTLVGALTAWIYNLTVPSPPIDEDYF